MNEITNKEEREFITYGLDIVDRYLNYIDVTKTTYDTYKNGLKVFFNYLKLNNIKNPTREHIINFREYLKQNHSLSTVNTYLISTRNFFKWLEYEELYKDITKNVKGVTLVREHRREPLTNEQVRLVLNNTQDLREKVIFMLGICCGCRANEICNIQLKDFVQKGDKILLYLLGKGRDGKVDYVVIDYNLYNLIQEYIKKYNIINYLFTSVYKNDGSKLTSKTIRYIVKNMFRRVGIDSELYTCHSMRHTFATENLLSGIDIREVSKAMRHKNTSTTEIYAHDIEKRNNQCFNTLASKFMEV